tara:strand:- start:182 stop:502 length:321 start_codon:yes stop_codon:yes gene_type:complete
MFRNEMPKTVAKWLEQNKEKVWAIDIEDTDPNENGDYSIWVYLKGYTSMDSHIIHRDTAKGFLDCARNIEKCESDCGADTGMDCTKDVEFAKTSEFYFDKQGKLTR